METKKFNIIINGVEVETQAGEKVLLAARRAGFDIPTLCFLKDINETANCRMCIVEAEINGRPMRGLPASCALEVAEGMVVKTNTARVLKAQKTNLELILANHNRECLSCIRNQKCELQTLSKKLGVDKISFYGDRRKPTIDAFSPSIIRDTSKCILCGRCVSTCEKVQGMSILAHTQRGFESTISPAFDHSLNDIDCLFCGQCIQSCPVGALKEKSEVDLVVDALNDKSKHVVVQIAPSVRAGLGEEFGYPIGTDVTGKIYTALHRLGFAKVFDTTFSADLTIMEEGFELIGRIKNGGVLPMLTSCSPGWIRFAEFRHPELIPHLSSCKSPQNMLGAVIKSYYAEKEKIDPKTIVSVSVMPCTAKKFEARRPEMEHNGLRDIDLVLTTRELGALIKKAGIDFKRLPDGHPDPLLGQYSGAGVIFGATGGVMEAALRTAAAVLSDDPVTNLDYLATRDLNGIKQGSVTVKHQGQPLTLKFAVAHSTSQAEKLIRLSQSGEIDVHFIEFMGCPGGCVTGGGQPIVDAMTKTEVNVARERAKVLYNQDAQSSLRMSHDNPEVQAIYRDYLGEPNSELAHHLLHTHYVSRKGDRYNK